MHNPIEVINILNIIYNAFDTRLDRFDAYKVETINDSYLVASGLPEENETHARFTIYRIQGISRKKSYFFAKQINAKFREKNEFYTKFRIAFASFRKIYFREKRQKFAKKFLAKKCEILRTFLRYFAPS